MLPSASYSLIGIGLIAGLIPDIDFLAELKGKVAAWTMHRIVAHNIPVALLLALLMSLMVWWVTKLPLAVVLTVCLLAAGIHLLLDVLTSFGTCLLYPFNNTRFTTRSHFIFDPVVILLSVAGVFSSRPVLWFAVLFGYLAVGWAVRCLLVRRYNNRLSLVDGHSTVQLEPRFLAPLRWLIIQKTNGGYCYAYQTLFWRSRWYSQQPRVSAVGDEPLLDRVISACQADTLLSAVLVTFDMPVYTLTKDNESIYVLVEDLKWRLEPQLRPMAFSARVADDGVEVVLENVTQGGFFQSRDTGLFSSVAMVKT